MITERTKELHNEVISTVIETNKLFAELPWKIKTDLDRTREFLDSLGVLYSVNPLKDSRRGLKFGRPSGCFGDEYPECDKVGGYTGFSTQFEFDKNGKFLTVGAWE